MSIKFIAGLAIGAAIMHFLNTDEGQAFIARFSRDIQRAGDDLADFTDEVITKGKAILGTEKQPESTEPLVVIVEREITV